MDTSREDKSKTVYAFDAMTGKIVLVVWGSDHMRVTDWGKFTEEQAEKLIEKKNTIMGYKAEEVLAITSLSVGANFSPAGVGVWDSYDEMVKTLSKKDPIIQDNKRLQAKYIKETIHIGSGKSPANDPWAFGEMVTLHHPHKPDRHYKVSYRVTDGATGVLESVTADNVDMFDNSIYIRFDNGIVSWEELFPVIDEEEDVNV